MVLNVNVLRPGVLDIIAAESNGTMIVTIQGNLVEVKVIVSVSAMAVSFGYQRPQLMVPLRYRKTRLSGSRVGRGKNDIIYVYLNKKNMFACLSGKEYTMADVNVNAPADQAPTMAPPTRTDDQIPPHIRWVHQANHLLLAEEVQVRPETRFSTSLANEEPVLGYLKFSAKGTKREVFGKHIPGNLITANIQGKPYYQEYIEKVAKYQRYIAGEQRSDTDSPAPKPTKATKKSKPSAPKADLRPPVIKPTSSQQPEPKPAPAKSSGKKRKLVTEISDKPSPARKSRPGVVSKRSKPISSLRSVDEFVVEGVPEKDPRVNDEEANVARDLLTLQTPKKKSPVDQYIFQRRTFTPTGSSGHDESSSLYVELGLTDSEARPNPDEQDEGQTGLNPGNAAVSRPLPSLVIHAGPNLEHMDLEVILEEPARSIGTLSSLQHLTKDLSFGDLFFNDKPSKADNRKTTAKIEAESMVSVIIQQDTFAIPPMTTPIRIGELEHIMANLIQDNKHLEERLDSHGARLYTLENLEIPQQHAKRRKKRRDSPKMQPGSPPHQPPPPPPPIGLSGTSGSPRASRSSHVPPPPPPPLSTNQEGQSQGSVVPSSSKTAASAEYKAWTTTNTRLRPATPEPAWSILSSDVPVPKNNWASTLASTYSPPLEDSLLAQTGPAFELVKVFHPNVIHLQYQMEECHKLLTDSVDDSIIRHNVSKPLPLGGPPSQVTIQSDFFLNKDLEYLIYGSKGSRPALSISKMKAAYYLDVGLKQMVPDQMWIAEECKHTSEGDHRAVRTRMQILSVVRIKVFSMYGYDYMKKIVLRRADLNEHIIAERDFKYLYPSDFEDLYPLNLQEDFQLGIESYQTHLNLTKPRWDATGFEYKHDYTDGPNPSDQDEGQARPNPDEQDEGQAGLNPGNAAVSRPLPSPVIHAGPNLEHMDLEENLKLAIEEQVILEEPASTTDSMLMKRIGELEHIMTNLIQDNKHLKERLDSHGARLYTLENLEIPQQPPPPSPPIGLSGTSGSPRASRSSHLPPPPPPPLSTNQEGQSQGSVVPSSSKIVASAEYKAWITTNTRLRPATPEPAWSILSSDVPVPKNNWASALASTYSPPLEDSLIAQTGDMAVFMDWFCKRQEITELKSQDLEGPAFELVKFFHPN
nr:hypothetical protein [Tanacetum cinerariifolium]